MSVEFKPRWLKGDQGESSMDTEVNSPPHYTAGGIETIDYIEAKELGYHLGNAVKYISRAGRKGSATTDIRKAIWYLERYLQTQCETKPYKGPTL